MANAVTACRDNAPADRTTATTTATDANIAAAIMAYLETSASQPLPPLALARRTGLSQSLPPVRSLLPPSSEDIPSAQDAAPAARNNVSNRKVFISVIGN